jgi:hypothetical protein
MAHVTQWRSKNPYIVRVQRHPVLENHWVLELPSGATFSAPARFDDDEDPVFSLPRAELSNHVALREQKAREMDFRAVQQSFEGSFSGKALLIFPETRSLELVRSI